MIYPEEVQELILEVHQILQRVERLKSRAPNPDVGRQIKLIDAELMDAAHNLEVLLDLLAQAPRDLV
ncbi:MAG: hypothetical protein D6715_10065 [Calditrichaeota bacterium]|nr:MAG: hypothetical protein D6715_10065 [Calditrichota bacterium]